MIKNLTKEELPLTALEIAYSEIKLLCEKLKTCITKYGTINYGAHRANTLKLCRPFIEVITRQTQLIMPNSPATNVIELHNEDGSMEQICTAAAIILASIGEIEEALKDGEFKARIATDLKRYNIGAEKWRERKQGYRYAKNAALQIFSITSAAQLGFTWNFPESFDTHHYGPAYLR